MRRDGAAELEFAAHAVLAVLHGLGALYQLRRGNRWQGAAHLAGLAFDGVAATRHLIVILGEDERGPIKEREWWRS